MRNNPARNDEILSARKTLNKYADTVTVHGDAHAKSQLRFILLHTHKIGIKIKNKK